MKRNIWGFLALLFITNNTWAIETNTIDTAETKEAAIAAYKSAANARIDVAKNTDKIPTEEITRATNTVNTVATNAEQGKLAITSGNVNKTTDTGTDEEETTNVPTDEEISELRDNYNAIKENEQSTANKLIGAAGIGAVGAGGMQLMQGLAEKNADESAEQDMAAYLATFRCKYADGKMVRGGETDVVLPTSAELTTLYTEYMALAADLKLRKENLNMAPGIESEVILNSANIGLYDDQSLGKADGAYTSVSRALLDKDSEDAKEWAAQKADAEKRVKVGAGLAIGGALVSGVASLIANKDAPEDKSEEILADYGGVDGLNKILKKQAKEKRAIQFGKVKIFFETLFGTESD